MNIRHQLKQMDAIVLKGAIVEAVKERFVDYPAAFR